MSNELVGSEAWLSAIGATKAHLHTSLRAYIPPKWCQMPKSAHECAGGCWGVWHGFVNQAGATYCRNCEYFDTAWADWVKPAQEEKGEASHE